MSMKQLTITTTNTIKYDGEFCKGNTGLCPQLLFAINLKYCLHYRMHLDGRTNEDAKRCDECKQENQ